MIKMKRINKILLVNPPGISFIQPDGSKQAKDCPPVMGLAYLASSIIKKNDCDVKIYDMAINGYYQERKISKNKIIFGEDFNQYKQVLEDYAPDLVGVSCLLSNKANLATKICDLTKEKSQEIITTVGGYHATAFPNFFLENNADFVMVGESDNSFPRLVDALNGKKDLSLVGGLFYKKNGITVSNPKIDFVKNLDELPFPAWDVVGLEKYWGIVPMGIPLKNPIYSIMNTSRGCPHTCFYCAVPKHTGKRNFR